MPTDESMEIAPGIPDPVHIGYAYHLKLLAKERERCARVRAALFEIRGMCDVGSQPSINEIGKIAREALKDE
jgi:hypothetical protein